MGIRSQNQQIFGAILGILDVNYCCLLSLLVEEKL